MNSWNVFTTIYNQLDVALLGSVNQILASLVAYTRPVVLATGGLVLAIGLLTSMTQDRGNSSAGAIYNELFRIALVAFAVSTVPVYNEYIGNLFTTILPNDLTNAVAGVVGQQPVNAEAFDHLGGIAWVAGEAVYKTIPFWSLSGISLGILVGLYWIVSGLAIFIAFLFFLVSHVLLAFLVSLGPLFLCCLLSSYTKSIFDRWVGAVVGTILGQVFIVAITTLLILTVGNEINQLAAGVPQGNAVKAVMTKIHILVECGFVMVVILFVTKELVKFAAHIGGGVAHSLRPATVVAEKATQLAGAGAGAVGGAAARAAGSGTANIARAVKPVGRAIG